MRRKNEMVVQISPRWQACQSAAVLAKAMGVLGRAAQTLSLFCLLFIVITLKILEALEGLLSH